MLSSEKFMLEIYIKYIEILRFNIDPGYPLKNGEMLNTFKCRFAMIKWKMLQKILYSADNIFLTASLKVAGKKLSPRGNRSPDKFKSE